MVERMYRARFVPWILAAVLVSGIFGASWATTSTLLDRISQSYQRAQAATDLALSVATLAASESNAISSDSPRSSGVFSASLIQARADNALWDKYRTRPVGFDAYFALESRIAVLLTSGRHAQAARLDQLSENDASNRISAALNAQAQAATRQAQRDDAHYKLLSLWTHVLLLLIVVLLAGGIGLMSYRREVDRRRLSEDSERKVRALLEHGGDAILLVDTLGVITFASGACPQILGVDVDEVHNVPFQEITRTLNVPRLGELVEAARRDSGELLTETMPLGDDDLTIVEVNVCDYSSLKTIDSTIINIRDITERLLTQAALEREETFSTNLMEHAPLFIYVKDLELRFLRVNHLVAQTLGKKADDLIGRTAAEVFTPDIATVFESNERRAIADGEFTTEQILNVDGVRTPMLATYFLLRESSGTPYAVAAVAMDLTEVEELRAVERELRVGVAHARDAMVTSYDGLITSWNRSAEEMFGYRGADIIGRDVSVLVAPSQRGWVPDFQSAVYAGQSVTADRIIGQRHDGSTFVGSLSSVPIIDEEGVVRGVSTVIHDRTTELMLEARLRTDSLTRLPNREALVEHLEAILQATRQGNVAPSSMTYLAKLRIDRFDQLLSVFGGSTAETLLRFIADRFTSFVQHGVFIARSGPRDFALTYSATSRADAERFLNEVLDTVTEPVEVDGRALSVSITAGVANCTGEDVGVLMSQTALLSQRERPIGSYPIAFFDESLHRQLVSDVTLIDELRSALGNQQFVPYFQPIVELATNEIVGFEALARWPHDTRGVVAPDQFIALAEDNGLIADLGQQIRLQACRRLVEWQREIGRPTLEMHLNVSVHELSLSDFVAATATMISESGVDPHTVVLEITESALANANETMATLRDVNALGVRWSVDDFGTGYSSLSYLRVFPFDSLKIDRSFVVESGNLKGRAMLKSIIDIATALNLSTISEGIETVEQRDLMIDLGGDRGQGYLWSRPVPADQAYELLLGDPGEPQL